MPPALFCLFKIALASWDFFWLYFNFILDGILKIIFSSDNSLLARKVHIDFVSCSLTEFVCYFQQL
jgi:hypothetical protein